MKTAEGGGLLQRGQARGRTASITRASWLAVSVLPVLVFACSGKPGECSEQRDCAAIPGVQAGSGGAPASTSGSGGQVATAGTGGSSGGSAPETGASAGEAGMADVETPGVAGAGDAAGAGNEPEPEVDPCDAFACGEGSCGLQHGLPVCDCPASITGKHCELPRFETLSVPAGFEHGFATAVTSDGSTIYGYALDAESNTQTSFRWTHEAGAVVMAPANYSITGVSADGSVAAGERPNGINASTALRWSLNEGFTELGQPPGGDENSSTTATAISADGATICGNATTAAGSFAFRWTASASIVKLPFPAAAGAAATMHVRALSSNGRTIAGEFSDPNVATKGFPFLWTSAGGTRRLGTGQFGAAEALSADGSQVFGWFEDSGRKTAFRWTAEAGFRALESAGTCAESLVKSVSADGRVAAGSCTSGNSVKAFIWDEARGVRSVESALGEFGMPVPAGRTLWFVDALSGDGKTVVGRSLDENGLNEAWVARLR
jgi:uncharacterized membrane protein